VWLRRIPHKLRIITSHHSILRTYMRPILTDRVAWSVGLSICHISEACKNGWSDRDAVWIKDSSGPNEPYVLHGVQIPHGNGQFWGETGEPLLSTGSLCGHLCNNDWTDRAAVWVVGSYLGPRNHVRWGSRSHMGRVILVDGQPL